ncbi:DUF4371 domain-containing protein [Trichonephila clavipes]|nr:DUF4371 domain-containing protein [Trichonephila clavipes]
MLKACEQFLRMQAVQKSKVIPMSATTIKCRIEDMAKDIENQIITMVKNSSIYSVQIDESTDITNEARLLCFVRNCCKGEEWWLPRHFIYTLHSTSRTTSSEKMSTELHKVLSNVIEIIKAIRHKALNSRVFEALWEEIRVP